MKKVLFVFAIATTLVACEVGSTKTEATTADTTVSTDTTTAVVAADTTAVVDSAK